MSRMLELPEPIFEALMNAARASGRAPADWIASRLPGASRPSGSVEEIRAARDRLWKHVVSTGRPTGLDNEAIDADLARAYGDPHDEKPASGSDS